jgi:hypothetical protein
MNDQNPNSPGQYPVSSNPSSGAPPAPPLIPGASVYPGAPLPPGATASEQMPIRGVVSAAEALLRQPRRVMFQLKQPNPAGLIRSLLVIALGCSLLYGLGVGTFSGGAQLWGAPVKIAVGMLLSALICLPSLYIFVCLSGAQARPVEVFGLVAGLLALMTILLIGFAPVAWVFSQSTKSVVFMGAVHLGFWCVAIIFGLRFLQTSFRHVDARSDGGFHVWVLIFLLVALQMTTALRPIVGKSDRFLPAAADKKFFVQHWMDCFNADPAAGSTNEISWK